MFILIVRYRNHTNSIVGLITGLGVLMTHHPGSTLPESTQAAKTLQVWHVGASDVTGLCQKVWHVVASDVTGLCHRFGMWCVRCHRFMSQVWACGASDVTGLCHEFGHVVRQMSQGYVTGVACGASECHRFMSQVWHVVRQMSQVYVTSLACGASDVTGLCHRCGMWCVRCHRFMSQVWHVVRQMSQIYVTGWHVVRQMSQVYVTGFACVRQKSCHVMYTALHCEKPVSRSGTLLNGWCKFHKSRYNSRHHFIMACGVFSGQIIFFM